MTISSTTANNPRRLTIDAIEPVIVSQLDHNNELNSLRMLAIGLDYLYRQVKKLEKPDTDQTQVFIFGGTNPAEKTLHLLVANSFHWFGNSVCNYARIVGFIRGLDRGEFVRKDLEDNTRFGDITKSVDRYVDSVSELAPVLTWRNKVFAHLAITSPRKNDNIATLGLSAIPPVTFEGRYFVGGMSTFRGGPAGGFKSELPKWSLTQMHELLAKRFLPAIDQAAQP